MEASKDIVDLSFKTVYGLPKGTNQHFYCFWSSAEHFLMVTGLKHDTLGYRLGYELEYGLGFGLGFRLNYRLGYGLEYGLGCRLGLICRCKIRGV